MRLVSIGFSLLLLAAVPAAAGDAPTLQPLRLDGTVIGTCAQPTDEAVRTSFGGDIGEQSTCSAWANCEDGTMVDCTGENTCTAVDQDCSVGQEGYVECDGVRTSCPSCCPCGTCGTIRWFKTEQCCPNNLHVMEERRCTTSGWVNTGNTDCLVECGGTQI